MNRPGAYSTFFTRPPTGARLTWTSSGERKIDTRTAGPTHGSIASVTTITRPSAGATTAPGRAGGVRSGSRKKPRQASAATMKTAAAAHQPIQPMIHAAAARGRMNGHPSEATGTRNRKPAPPPRSRPRRLDPGHHLGQASPDPLHGVTVGPVPHPDEAPTLDLD